MLRSPLDKLPDIKSPLYLLGVFILAYAIILLAMPCDLFVYDEGIILVDAMRVLNGQIIHRDFYATYGPGQYYIVAGLFRLFGEQFMVERLYDVAIRSLSIAVLFAILRECLSPITALLFTAMGSFWMIHTLDAPIYPVFPCIPLSLLGTYLLVSAPTYPMSIRSLAGAGATTGLSALFRYDVGFLMFVAHLAPITWRAWRAAPAGERSRYWLKAVAIYVVAAALAFSPAVILVLANSALGGFVADIIDYPSKYYARMRSLPLPGLDDFRKYPVKIGLYFPLVAGALALVELYRFIRTSRTEGSSKLSAEHDREPDYLIAFGAMSALLFIKGVVRINAIHMVLAIMPALVVFAIVARRWWQRGAGMRAAAMVGAVVALVPTVDGLKEQVGHSYRQKDRAFAQLLATRVGLISPLPEALTACTTAPATGIAKLFPEYVRAVNYLDAHSRPEERILIGLKRHDIVPANAMALYFAANRLPGSHWAEYDPGQQTRADIQSAMIEELKRNAVRWIVRDGSFDYHNERNDSSKSSGVKLLDEYIDANYREVASSGKVSIWLSNVEPAPSELDSGDCLPQPVK